MSDENVVYIRLGGEALDFMMIDAVQGRTCEQMELMGMEGER